MVTRARAPTHTHTHTHTGANRRAFLQALYEWRHGASSDSSAPQAEILTSQSPSIYMLDIYSIPTLENVALMIATH